MSTGLFNTSILTTDLAKKSFAGMITRLMPNGSAPLFGMTSMLGSETAVQTEHGFFTKTMLFPQLTTSSSALSTDTTLAVTSTVNILPGMIMRVDSTGENIIVNTIASATSSYCSAVVLVKLLHKLLLLVLTLYQVGNAFEEASIRPNALNINPVRITNLHSDFP
jgi:hypothetical protein